MDPVATMARLTAADRAVESQRPDRLFDDPFAAALAGEEGFALKERVEKALQIEGGNPFLPIRTRFFDDFLLQVVNDGKIKQVVLIAAGMDTRAFRLPWPEGTAIYELDRPELLATKEAILTERPAQPRYMRRTLGVDLTADWDVALCNAGFDREAPSVWLAEGFFMYLSAEDVEHILRKITGLSTEGSWLGADLLNRVFFTSSWTQQRLRVQQEIGAPWQYGVDDPKSLFARHGWEATVIEPGHPDANYGRWPYPVAPADMPNMPRTFLVMAQRKRREAG